MPALNVISVNKEYEKNREISPEDVKNMRQWIITQPHLPHEYITGHSLYIYRRLVGVVEVKLRGVEAMPKVIALVTDLDIVLASHKCDHNEEDTKKLIDLNFSLRNLFSFYQNRKINKSLENALNTWLITPLKTWTAMEYRAIYCQILNTDPSKFVYSDVVRAFVMIMDLWQAEEGTVPGLVVILNMDQVLLGHLYQIELTVAQQFFYFLQEAMFVRLKEFHIINAPSFVDRLLAMVQPFMKKELLHMLRIHTIDSCSLDQHFSSIEFSEEIRQMNGVEISEQMWRKLKENEKFFEYESKKRVDETKRPEKSLTMSEIFSGMEDTFRCLQID